MYVVLSQLLAMVEHPLHLRIKIFNNCYFYQRRNPMFTEAAILIMVVVLGVSAMGLQWIWPKG